MISGTDYEHRFTQAQNAYLEGDLNQASQITEGMIRDYPDDPRALLLKGHIHLRQQKYEIAKITYERVLSLTEQEEIVSLADQGLEQIKEELEQEAEDENFYPPEVEELNFEDDIEEIDDDEMGDDWTDSIQFDSIDWDAEDLEDEGIEDPTLQQNSPFESNFTPSSFNAQSSKDDSPFADAFVDEKNLEDHQDQESSQWNSDNHTFNQTDKKTPDFDSHFQPEEIDVDLNANNLNYDDFAEEDDFIPDSMPEDSGADTFVVSSSGVELENSELDDLEQMLTNTDNNILNDFDDEMEYSSELKPLTSASSSVNSLAETSIKDEEESLLPEGEEGFFFTPDELGANELDDIPDIGADELPVSSIFTKEQNNNDFSSEDESSFDHSEITGIADFNTNNLNLDDEEEIGIPSSISAVSSMPSTISLTPEVEVPQGKLSKYYNLPLQIKYFVHGGVTAISTFLLVFLVSIFQGNIKVEGQEKTISYPWTKRLLLSLVAGIAGGGATLGTGYLLTNHTKRYTSDLQTQFESIYQGDYEVKATVRSQDEFGTLAAGFNQMARMINTTTTEARKRAEETERAREDLQRQVIRLLDDVEGAARGDLTVQAEVTADVLGAVADAFNLTITNLRKIVKQVQKAAVQVNKASTDSEVFARNQSSDALRMAEELAVTLNSVQMMTDSIQRVAENAREAEEVARSSSVTALKGGDAVERTVAGILQIRETVSETTRKVKRLAEASQQISTIVAVISQISSRTNLLALNASIQAARAGEAGRGFAIVADEVRQLADRSAKSLQEIEQIVLQIQTETGSVMTAMEEGIQQVLDVTERSEQAKRSLEDIIQVSNRIDALVRSITADTDEQRENSRAVAKVMQAVELTAQATSQESQRVAGSLQNLVGIAKDLIGSVERFKVEGEK